MIEQFVKTVNGVYINPTGIDTRYNGYTFKRDSQDPVFYQERKIVLGQTFRRILTPLITDFAKENNRRYLDILDVGCGDGVVLAALSQIGEDQGLILNLYGFDLDNEALMQITAPNIKLNFGSALRLPYSDNSFDIVISTQMIEHLKEEELESALRQMQRALRFGGLLYLETPNPESIETIAMGDKWPMYLPEHLTFVPPKALKCILKDLGFKDVSTTTRVEIDSQINEAWEVVSRLKLPGTKIIPWRLRLGLMELFIKAINKGSITVGLAKKERELSKVQDFVFDISREVRIPHGVCPA